MSANYDAGLSGTPDRASASNATRKLGEQSGRVMHEVQELGRVAASSAGELATKLREKGEHALEVGRDRARVARTDLEDAIRENPLRSVLIALGVGAVIGYVLHRRN